MIKILLNLLNRAECPDAQKPQDMVSGTTKEDIVVFMNEECRLTQNEDYEINILESVWGKLHANEKIEIGLHDLLELLPRTRHKADAYKGLKSKLKKKYGVELLIINKTHTNYDTN